MVNQLSKFSDHLADITKPLRELLLKDRTWVWGEAQQQAFNQIKKAITESPILVLFDPKMETIVAADASSYGLGAVLLQRQNNREIKPIAFVSRALTPTESRYAQIEKDALGITWVCERLSDYLVGLKFHIHTDHKPLYSTSPRPQTPRGTAHSTPTLQASHETHSFRTPRDCQV